MRAKREAGTCKHSIKFYVAELNAKILVAMGQTKLSVALWIDLWHCAVCFGDRGMDLILTTTAEPKSHISKGNIVTVIIIFSRRI